MDAKAMWECGNCGTAHEDYDEAKVCCIPSAKRVYVCNECEESDELEKEAEEYCGPSGDDECICTHKRSSHEGDGGECFAFINEMIGDCPCQEFNAL